MATPVVDIMLPFMQEHFGNAGSISAVGITAGCAVDIARNKVASFIGSRPEQVVFTASGSEANSLALIGIEDKLRANGKTHILGSAIEHDSVRGSLEHLAKHGFDVEYVPVMQNGVVNVDVLQSLIRPETGLVSVMYVNNEIGSVQPVREIGALCRRNGVVFHTDCVQAAGEYALDVEEIGCDFLTISAHKIRGPKGCGALFVRDISTLTPIIFGGTGQEFGVRGGTENVPAIVGFGEACYVASRALPREDDFSRLKTGFLKSARSVLSKRGISSKITVNGRLAEESGRILNITIEGVDAESLVLALSSKGVYVSAGSACRSHELEPSHVLMAIGLSAKSARESIRISFSATNTIEEARAAGKELAGCIELLQRIS